MMPRLTRAAAVWITGVTLALASCASDPVFHGEWRVVLFTAPGNAALAPTEAADWIGTDARYDSHRATFGRDTCTAPAYATRTMTADEFANEYRVRSARLGLEGETVTLVTITCPSAWTNRGSLLIVKSRDALLTMWDGVFFELERRIP